MDDVTGVDCDCDKNQSETTSPDCQYGQSDTILLHSGQELRDETDLFLHGLHDSINFKLKRRHISGGSPSNPNSIFGAAWSCNYQRELVWDGIESFEELAFGRVEKFHRFRNPDVSPDIMWHTDAHTFSKIQWDKFTPNASPPVLHRPGGLRLEYGGEILQFPSSGPQTKRWRLKKIHSPQGGVIEIFYGGNETPQTYTAAYSRISHIVDSFGRQIDFEYGHGPSFPGVVSEVTDNDGRVFAYEYIPSGASGSGGAPMLESFRAPATLEHPAGRVTGYEYDLLSSTDPLLKYNLTGVVFPNQYPDTHPLSVPAVNPGVTRLSWTYFDTAASGDFFTHSRVKSHTIGNRSIADPERAGGTYVYDYKDLRQPNGSTIGVNDVAVEIEVRDRRENRIRYVFNRQGQMLSETILTDLRGAAPSSGYKQEWTYRDSGVLLTHNDFMGASLKANMVTDANGNSWFSSGGGQGGMLRLPDPAREAITDQSDLQSRIRYEPLFNKPYKVVDERGFEPGNNIEDYTTTFIYDYMELDLEFYAPEIRNLTGYDLEDDIDYRRILSNLGLPLTGLGDVNGDGLSGYRGNLVRIIHPRVTLPTQASSASVAVVQEADELFRYNVAGQLVWHRDEEGNITEHTYYAGSGNYAGQLGDQFAGGGGFLRSTTRDSDASIPGRNSGHASPPTQAETFFLYTTNPAGFGGTSYTRALPTSIIDARSVRTDMAFDEADVLQRVTRAADTQGSSGLTPFSYWEEYDYDLNGNRIASRILDKDNAAGTTGVTASAYTYDILDNVKSLTEDIAGIEYSVSYAYDEEENLVEQTEANPGNIFGDSKTAWTFDERGIQISETSGAGSAFASTVSTGIDANGNITRVTDAEGGNSVFYDFDGYDRSVGRIDRDQTVWDYKLDAVGNVVGGSSYGSIRIMDTSGAGVLAYGPLQLSGFEADYDARNRRYQIGQSHFHYPGLGNGQTSLDNGALGANGSLIRTVTVHDRMGRRILEVDAEGDETLFFYDGMSRTVRAIDAASNVNDYTYDANSNLLTTLVTEKSSLNFNDQFAYSATYDALNRMSTRTAPNQQQTQYDYDSRDNLIRTIDELGNEVEYVYDRLDRPTSSIQYLKAGGVGASSSNLSTMEGGDPALTGAGAPDGKITISQEWDALGRLVKRIDDRGNETTYLSDTLDRTVLIKFGDGTTEQRRYNRDSELIRRVDQEGFIWLYRNDVEGRRISAKSIPSSAAYNGPIVGTSTQAWSYDGLGRLWSHFDDNGASGGTSDDVRVRFHLDSIGRRILEKQQIGDGTTSPVLTTALEYQGARRLAAIQYPGQRKIVRQHDSLDRLSAITENGATILQRDYVGTGRIARQWYGNGAVLDKRNDLGDSSIMGAGAGFDQNGRTIRHEWRASADPGAAVLTSYLSTYNGPNGIGTDRRASETRQHLPGHHDIYEFDSAYRMIGFKPNGSPWITRKLDGVDKMYSYVDESGMETMPQVDQHTNVSENGLNQYSQFGPAQESREYDNLGSLTEVGGVDAYRMDSRKRMSQVFESGSLAYRYIYDATNRRVAKLDASGDVATRYSYDGGWRVLEEYDDQNALTAQFVDGTGLDDHVQMRRFGTPGQTEDFYYHCNSQGSVGAISSDPASSAAAEVVEYYEYGIFGSAKFMDGTGSALLVDESPAGNPYLFHGRRLDSEAGLYHYRNRQYDPVSGSFMSIDPTGLWAHGQGNGYSAFNGDPINHVDPTGEFPFLLPFIPAAVGSFTAAEVTAVGGATVLLGAGIAQEYGDKIADLAGAAAAAIGGLFATESAGSDASLPGHGWECLAPAIPLGLPASTLPEAGSILETLLPSEGPEAADLLVEFLTAGVATEIVVNTNRDKGAGRGDPHGGENHMEKALKEIEALEKKLKCAVTKKAKQALRKTIQRIRETAQKKGKGGTHGRRGY